MTAPTILQMTPATSLARLAVEALAGVGHVVLCPGSRSAPLAYALAAAEAGGGPDLHVRHDERVAAFVALGASGAVVTTSGTAAANLHPAVLEAHHAGRPLVVVTADRPPALRGTWANQTSELQVSLYGNAVRARLDLADTDAARDPDGARAAVRAVVAAAFGAAGRPGPVHLDLGFTEPLVPDDDGASWTPARPAWSARAEPDDRPLTLAPGPRTVVLAGDGATPAARGLAERGGWPLLAEPSSGARGGTHAIGPYRLLLERAELGGAVERVVVFGRPTLSRPVTALLARDDVEAVLVSPYPDWPEPGRPVRRCSRVEVPAPDPDGEWLVRWQRAGAAAAAGIDAVLDAEAAAGRLTGPLVARELAAALRPGETLVVAASNPIRDVDLAARPPVGRASLAVVANRGLAGIDGTLATATGRALRDGGRVRALVGDVAFLHDAGALLLGPGERRPDLQVVVLNDDGGGIFELLEYGATAAVGKVSSAAVFERLFGTPHGADLGALCRAFGVPHELVKDADRLLAVLAGPLPGISVVEVRAERGRLRALHARLRAAGRER
ncbi:MAG TPA: 2-succinyl-5-enolpyruvyl-6-hydroxy-3-cyclohexene-1-carboxylic-acid synthase [Kineosporiaceae bacterium]